MKNKDDKQNIENELFKSIINYLENHKGMVLAAAMSLLAVSCIIPVLAGKNNIVVPIYPNKNTEETTSYEIWEEDDESETETHLSSSLQTTEEETAATVKFPLNINHATADELVQVKGIGEVLAQRIVDYRNINGYYYSLEDLLNVEGIGKKKLSSFNGYLCIDYAELPETLPPFHDTEQTEAPVSRELTTVTTVPPKKKDTEKTTSTAHSKTTEDEYEELYKYIIDDIEEDEYDYNYMENIFDIFQETYETTQYRPQFPIDLNSASAEDLTYIKGIGEVTANRIVEYARTVGFTCVDDLLNINGIGPSKLEDIRPYVYVDQRNIKFPPATQTQYTFSYYETTYESFISQPTVYRVNVNTCGKEDLMQLPGITEQLADSIIELRTQIGYFKNVEEVSLALSDEQLAKIIGYIYV